MKLHSYADEYSEVVAYPDPALPIKTWIARSSDFPALSDVNHWHNDFELLYVLDGHMKCNINGEIVPLDKGALLFVNSRMMHFGFQDEYAECRIRCMMFHPSLLALSPLEESLEKICGTSTPPYLLFHTSRLADASVIECVKSIDSAFCSQGPSRSLSLLAGVYLLCAKLIEQIASTSANHAHDSKQLQAMHRMTGFIQRNYSEKISLNDIAEAGAVCRSKCCRFFKEFLSKTPVEYLTEYRISRSADLLKHSEMSVTEIALSCGFCSSSYYAETFLKLMKCTPREYRKR